MRLLEAFRTSNKWKTMGADESGETQMLVAHCKIIKLYCRMLMCFLNFEGKEYLLTFRFIWPISGKSRFYINNQVGLLRIGLNLSTGAFLSVMENASIKMFDLFVTYVYTVLKITD